MASSQAQADGALGAAAAAAASSLAPLVLRAVGALVLVRPSAVIVVTVAAAAVATPSFVLLRAAPTLRARRHGGGSNCGRDRAAGFKTSRRERASYSTRHGPGWSQRCHELKMQFPVPGTRQRMGRFQVRERNSPGHSGPPRTGWVRVHVHASACSSWRGITYVLPYLQCCGRKVCTHLAREAACQQEGGCNHCTASTMPTACCTSRRSRWGEGRQAQSYQSIARISKAATVA